MQKPTAARAARLLIILAAVALFASSCGGSDDTDVALNPTAEPTVDATAESAGDAASPDDATAAADDDDGAPAAEADPPAASVAVETRDCAHTSAELAGGDTAAAGDDGASDEDVELPPASKPPVDQQYFGEFDELITTDLIVGTGQEAVAGAIISMQYVGVLASDGTEFDSSWDRGAQPFEFPLGGGRVIAGWDEGIEGMRVGGRRVLQIPSAQAYGERGSGDIIGPDADLIFIVDMVGTAPGPGVAPEIPADTLGSFDELGVVDLVEGEGCEVQVGDIVTVNYLGVTADGGVEFDNSFSRGEPFSVIAGRSSVIDGWNEGLVGMKVGGERILQIPSTLAYGADGAGGAIGPDADLVFRVHLVSLVEAPYAHTVTFSGDAPTEAEITTVTEGTGDGAEEGDILNAKIAVFFFRSGEIIQSTWESGQPAQLALQDGAALPGLNEAVLGIKTGEVRQVVLPPAVAYPDGIPENAGFGVDDALVFIIEVTEITAG